MHLVQELIIRKMVVVFNSLALSNRDDAELLELFESIAYFFELSTDGGVVGDGITFKQPPNGFVGMEVSGSGITLSFGNRDINGKVTETKREFKWPVIRSDKSN